MGLTRSTVKTPRNPQGPKSALRCTRPALLRAAPRHVCEYGSQQASLGPTYYRIRRKEGRPRASAS
eukprot:4842525-Prymnesium_polylepis.1